MTLTSELDAFCTKYTNPILLRRVKFALPTFDQKEKEIATARVAISFWSKCGDSNSRPPVPETGALPTALHLEIRADFSDKNTKNFRVKKR